MGSLGRWYVRFANGKEWAVAPRRFWDDVRERGGGRAIKTVAFGEDWDAHFIVFADGWWTCSGSVPEDMMEKIESRGCAADLDFVSLGPNGEWFLSAKNGRAWFSGIDMGKHGNLRSVVFGDNGSYMVRHS
mmetsp:Transcript_90442/g.240218  ORF Transcript_90442/g.240218 Transcript_90442/m.240218 type:complete len:131 (-) Transcript_90442:12-404(-)